MPEPPPDAADSSSWTPHCGVWAIHLQADLTRAALRQPFLVTETNALSIGDVAPQLPRLRRPVAPGGVGAGGPRRADGRVLALALDPLRPRAVLAGRAQPRRRARPLLRRGHADRGRLRARGRRGRRPRAGRRRRAALQPREQVGDGVPPAAGDRGRRRRPRLLRAHLQPLLRGPVRRPACRPRSSTRRTSTATGTPVPDRVPRLYVADDALLDRLAAYARAGGHLVLELPRRLRRPRGAPAHGGAARPAARGRRRDLRRVHEPHAPRCARAADLQPAPPPPGPTHCNQPPPRRSCTTSTRISDAGRRSPPTSTGRAA